MDTKTGKNIKEIEELRLKDTQGKISNLLNYKKDSSIKFIYDKFNKYITIKVSKLKAYDLNNSDEVNRLKSVAEKLNAERVPVPFTIIASEDGTTYSLLLRCIEGFGENSTVLETLDKLYYYLNLVKPEDIDITDRITVLFKPTHRCNMDCSYCYDKPYRDVIKEDMSMDTLRGTLDVLTKGAKSIDIIWHGGEITLLGTKWFREAHNIIETEYKHHDIGRYSCMSNGMLLNEEWFKTFSDLDIEPGVSYNYKTQEELRGNADIENLMHLARKYEVRMGVIDVMTNKNIENAKEAYDYYNRNHTPACFNRVFTAGEATKNKLLLEQEDFMKKYADYLKHVLHHRRPLIQERSFTEAYNFIINPRNNTCTYNECRSLWLGVNPIGDIYPCDRYFPERYKAGNVKNFKNLKDVYFSEGYLNYVEDVEYRMVNTCRPCKYFHMCNGGCNANSIAATGTCKEVDENFCMVTGRAIDIAYLTFRDVDIMDQTININLVKDLIETNTFLPKEIANAFLEINPEIEEFIKFTEEDKKDPLESNEFKVVSSINYLDKETRAEYFSIPFNEKMLSKPEEIDNLLKTRQGKLREFIREIIGKVKC